MTTATVGEGELCYEILGTGPRVLFVNGTGSDLRVRPNVLDSPLTRRCEVLTYDHRGLGRSSVSTAPMSMADYADDAAALMDTVGWSAAAVVGASFGGMVAQEIAIRHPQRASSLVLACTSSGGAGGSSHPLHELQSLEPKERIEHVLSIADVRHDASWRQANDQALAALLASQIARLREVENDPDRARGQEHQLQARRHHDTWERLGLITCPTLIAAGRYDGIAPLVNSEQLSAAIPNSILEVFEGGHGFLAEDPRAWEAVIAFVCGSPA